MTDAEPAPARDSLIKVQIAGKTYDARSVPQCKTCQHPARRQIEEQILLGHSYRAIADQFSGTTYTGPGGREQTFPSLEYMSIFTHFKRGHIPVEAAVMREIADRRARQLGDYDEYAERFADAHSFAQEVVQVTHQRLASGEIKPDIKDGVAAAKLLADLESAADGSIDNEVWSQAMTVYFEVTQQLMTSEQWQQLTQRLATHPVLQSLARRLEAGSEPALEADAYDEEGNPL